MTLTSHLAKVRDAVEGHARAFGLDFFDVIFEVVSLDELNMVAAYGGFPTRYPHWKFGMEYDRLSKSHEYGLSRIYELVINNDPSYAYLLASNSDIDQKLVMAHVYGHSDFFKNNFAFAPTNRRMIDVMANHATKIRRYIDRHGWDKVEAFMDRCLSIENLVDRQSPYIKRRPERRDDGAEASSGSGAVPRLRTDREYMTRYINPDEFVAEQRRKIEKEKERVQRIPEQPEYDVMWFLLEHAPLENWQRDILGMLRDEAYYFSPQGLTKIMNEGWASYWHTTILTQKALESSEVIDYAERHAGTMAVQPGSINPYKLGLELFRDIEERWNKGRFGKDWEQCDDLATRRAWDTGTSLGREKIFEVRRHYNDVTFIDEFLTQDFAIEHKLFAYDYNRKNASWEIASREFKKVKDRLLSQLTNFGQPFIAVVDSNLDNRGELFLAHRHDGIDLRDDYMRDTLQNLWALWTRPVALWTRRNDKATIVRFDGQNVHEAPTSLARPV